jgi:hypothetical protein
MTDDEGMPKPEDGLARNSFVIRASFVIRHPGPRKGPHFFIEIRGQTC